VSNVALFIRGTKARMKGTKENALKAFGNILIKARVQSGGYISHLAVGLTVIGLVGSIMYVEQRQFDIPLETGAQVTVSNYTFELREFTTETIYYHDNEEIREVAQFAVYRDGVQTGYILPTRYYDPIREMNRINASVMSEPLRDIFLTFGSGEIENSIPITIMINPLIWVMWIGSGLLLAGNALAAWPKAQPKPKSALPAGAAGGSKPRSKAKTKA
jgi:cytochrome c biogenesis factor